MRDLEDFLYHIETMETRDLTSHALDDVWLADLTDEELIGLIHQLITRIPNEEEDWYEDEELVPEDDDEAWDEY